MFDTELYKLPSCSARQGVVCASQAPKPGQIRLEKVSNIFFNLINHKISQKTIHIFFITLHILFVTVHILMITLHILFVTVHILFVTVHILIITLHILFILLHTLKKTNLNYSYVEEVGYEHLIFYLSWFRCSQIKPF